MKALSVRQPWADLIASGEKTLEIRSWRIDYRGPLLICASSKRLPKSMEYFGRYGVMICIVNLADCRSFEKGDEGVACCEWEPGLYAWKLGNVRHVESIPVQGKLRLFAVPDDLIKLR